MWRDGEGEGGEALAPQPKAQLALAVIERALDCLPERPAH